MLAWPVLAPPGVAPERVAELRTAFERMHRDPELLADASRQGLEVDAASGQELQDLVEALYRTPSDVLDYVRRMNAGN